MYDYAGIAAPLIVLIEFSEALEGSKPGSVYNLVDSSHDRMLTRVYEDQSTSICSKWTNNVESMHTNISHLRRKRAIVSSLRGTVGIVARNARH